MLLAGLLFGLALGICGMVMAFFWAVDRIIG